MKRWILAAVAVAALIAVPVQAQQSTTTPTPRQVAEKMREMCRLDGASIIGPNDPREAGPVLVTLPDGTFAIKEYSVTRARNFAAIMISRNPIYSLLYVTFPERIGNGYIDTDHDDFQRNIVDCFYGAYIGMDVVK